MTFFVAAGCALAALPACLWLAPKATVQICANVFFFVYLLLELLKLPRLTAAFLKHNAADEDEPTWLIVAVTFVAVVVSVGSLFLMLNRGREPEWWELTLSLAAVALGWLTIHTMAAHHYAHLYWPPGPDQGGDAPAKVAEPRADWIFPATTNRAAMISCTSRWSSA